MHNIDLIWKQLLSELKNIFSSHLYDIYISTAKPISLNQNIFTVLVDNNNHKTIWKNYILKNAETALNTIVPQAKIDIIDELFYDIPKSPTIATDTPQKVNLNPSYTFDNFVVGTGNLMAHAAALAVSENPGVIYNPLFFYGGSGLGKTHLMHAIGNSIIKNNPNAIIRYVTSEDFVNEFTNAIRNGAMSAFKNKFRKVDLLLVDDIQFLAGKEQTLDEFFHTFEVLHEAGKQIVLTSDRLASEIPQLPNRLVTRFGSGLSSDITPPDLETRTAILRKKAYSLNIDIQDDTISFIAGQVNSNVRELEGALNRVNFYAVTNRSPITTALAAEALKGIITNVSDKVASIYDIQLETSRIFNVSIEQLKGKKRTKDIVIPRQVAMFLCREITSQSLPKIGQEFGGKDHTTVMHACEKIQQVLDDNSDNDLIQLINQIRNKF